MANLPIVREEVRNPEYLTHTDEHPYCDDPTCPCQADVEPLPEQDDETGTHPPNCRCAWCEPYEPPYTRADQAADQATADYYDELQRRNETRQCSDGSWW